MALTILWFLFCMACGFFYSAFSFSAVRPDSFLCIMFGLIFADAIYLIRILLEKNEKTT